MQTNKIFKNFYKIMAIILLFSMIIASYSFANEKNTYQCDVKMMKYDNPNSESMANKALDSTAKITIDDDTFYIDLTFKEMSLGKITGHLTNLFVLENDQKVETQIIEKDGDFPKIIRITTTKDEFLSSDESQIPIAIWVDVMGGENGEQKAILKFDKEAIKKALEKKDEDSNESKNKDENEEKSEDKIEDEKKEENNKKNKPNSKKKNNSKKLPPPNEDPSYDAAKNIGANATSNYTWENDETKETITYEVPVEVLRANQSGYSMANSGINHTATVIEQENRCLYKVEFYSIERSLGGKTLTGNIDNLFIYDGNKYQASGNGNEWSFVMDGKYDKVGIALWIDIMDQIVGKGRGSGEQNATLSFDWNNAKEISRTKRKEIENTQNKEETKEKKKEDKPKNEEIIKERKKKKSFQNIVIPKDINEAFWAKDAIIHSVQNEYFDEIIGEKFSPNTPITRAQFVVALGKMMDIDINKYYKNNFKDVQNDAYYCRYIIWANENGIVNGISENNFAPYKALTREEMTVITSKVLKLANKNLKKIKSPNFTDMNNISSWAKDSVMEMAEIGIVNGMKDGKFNPKSTFTRAEVSQVLYNIDSNN